MPELREWTVSRGQIWVMRFTTVREMLHDTTRQKNRLERRLEVGKGNNRAGLGVSNRRPDAAAMGLEYASGDAQTEAGAPTPLVEGREARVVGLGDRLDLAGIRNRNPGNRPPGDLPNRLTHRQRSTADELPPERHQDGCEGPAQANGVTLDQGWS